MIQNATRLLVGIYFMINHDNAHMQMSWRVSEDKNDVDHVPLSFAVSHIFYSTTIIKTTTGRNVFLAD